MDVTPIFELPKEEDADLPGWSVTGGPDGSYPLLPDAVETAILGIDQQTRRGGRLLETIYYTTPGETPFTIGDFRQARSISIEAVGGGGAGGGSGQAGMSGIGGGGASGAYVSVWVSATQLPATVTVTVGAGGGGTGSDGGGGTTSRVAGFAIAPGGEGGRSLTATLAPWARGGNAATGGVGDVVIPGRGGRAGMGFWVQDPGGNITRSWFPGQGAGSPRYGGAPSERDTATPTPGFGSGGNGRGGLNELIGVDGASGLVLISVYV